jgi:hypothetical protein
LSQHLLAVVGPVDISPVEADREVGGLQVGVRARTDNVFVLLLGGNEALATLLWTLRSVQINLRTEGSDQHDSNQQNNELHDRNDDESKESLCCWGWSVAGLGAQVKGGWVNGGLLAGYWRVNGGLMGVNMQAG